MPVEHLLADVEHVLAGPMHDLPDADLVVRVELDEDHPDQARHAAPIRCAEVIEELKKLRDSGEHPALGDDLQGEIDYFTANRQRMDYRRYRELGLPIGSGTVESACKSAPGQLVYDKG